MTIVHDEDFNDSIALLALGVLTGAEAKRLATHVETCAQCRALYATMRSTADLVGYQAEALAGSLDDAASGRLKSRIMQAIATPALPEVASLAQARNGRATTTSVRQANRPWLAWTLAAAAALVAGFETVSNASLRSDNARLATASERQAEAAETAATRSHELSARLAMLMAPGTKHYGLRGGDVVTSRGTIVIALRDMPALPAGKVYQAWTRKRGAHDMTPGAMFVPDATGVAFVELPVAAASVDAVAVSVEPAAGSTTPTTKPTIFRALT